MIQKKSYDAIRATFSTESIKGSVSCHVTETKDNCVTIKGSRHYDVFFGDTVDGDVWFACQCKGSLHNKTCKHIVATFYHLQLIPTEPLLETESQDILSSDDKRYTLCPECLMTLIYEADIITKGCEHYPLPYLKPSSDKKVEKIGNVRI